MFRSTKFIQRLLRQKSIKTFSHWISTVSLQKDHLQLDGDGQKMNVHYFWLRDHCKCPKCYHPTTNQRLFDILSVPLNVRPTEAQVPTDDQLSVTWPDGHESNYSIKWLKSIWRNKEDPDCQVKAEMESKVLWNGEQMSKMSFVKPVPYASVMGTKEGMVDLYKNIVKYGFGIVNKTPYTDPEVTKELMEKVGIIQQTIYGDFWVFSAKMEEHADTAYTNEALGAHHDSTYYIMAPGLQVFHALTVAQSGGETLLVDAFDVADKLRKENPEAFDCLSRFPIPHHNIEPGVHLRCDNLPVIRVHQSTNQIFQVRFNPYDRAPLVGLSSDETDLFYRSYTAFSDMIRDKQSEYWIKLQPGTVLFIDNWRVMHGRAAFIGARKMCGGYMSMGDFMSNARVLGAF